jgi:hypothetical protein
MRLRKDESSLTTDRGNQFADITKTPSVAQPKRNLEKSTARRGEREKKPRNSILLIPISCLFTIYN